MINATPGKKLSPVDEDKAVDAILRAGPWGAVVLAGTATAVVVAVWLIFYLVVFLARVTPP
jgi:hypothetical protein